MADEVRRSVMISLVVEEDTGRPVRFLRRFDTDGPEKHQPSPLAPVRAPGRWEVQ
jgi:hypothetical protein